MNKLRSNQICVSTGSAAFPLSPHRATTIMH